MKTKKKMKTTYLDNEIILLEGCKKDGTISHYQKGKLAEYKQIKQLLLHNVSNRRKLLIDCVRACLQDEESVTVEQQVDTYLHNKGRNRITNEKLTINQK